MWTDDQPLKAAAACLRKKNLALHMGLKWIADDLAGLLDNVAEHVGMDYNCCDRGAVRCPELASPAMGMAYKILDRRREIVDQYLSCPQKETENNPCACPCTGCEHNCSAHDPEGE